MKIIRGDIFLYKPKNLIEKIICFITKRKYCHIELYIGYCKSICIKPFGIKLLNIKDINFDNVDIYRPRYSNLFYRYLALEYAINTLREIKCYSIFHFLFFLFIKFLRKIRCKLFEGNKFIICSEFVADCLSEGRVIKFKDVFNSLLSPGDIPRIFNVKKIK